MHPPDIEPDEFAPAPVEPDELMPNRDCDAEAPAELERACPMVAVEPDDIEPPPPQPPLIEPPEEPEEP